MAPSAISTSNSPEGLRPVAINGQKITSSLKMDNLSLSPNQTLTSVLSSESLDLVCVGFGPASLAIAIALHDAYSKSSLPPPKVLFLERQPEFAWHAGMQLPGARMQISFLKDLATPRDPRSKFTFINYLHCKGRLNTFINLSTFLPSRMEYEDYLRWCASHFEKEGCVKYGANVESVVPSSPSAEDGKIPSFTISSSSPSGELITHSARHVVIAVGGKPIIPPVLQNKPCVLHSSQFATNIGKIEKLQKERRKPLRFAVIGSGQSAAEIYNDLWERFGEETGVTVKLLVKGQSLRPSDDSPFVNEIFDPDRVTPHYNRPSHLRAAGIVLDRATNYGVVRLELLEHLYEKLYIQRIKCERTGAEPRAAIIINRRVTSATASPSQDSLRLKIVTEDGDEKVEEELDVDYIFTATGYRRDAHVSILEGCEELATGEGSDVKGENGLVKGKWAVGRDYRVKMVEGRVQNEAGIWLQGCNESTHGLSDSLLSILAIRGGELVESMFGEQLAQAGKR
ncbi:hypothetical protein SS1G_03696 [Sclerotinia sclerotiorum 1980 UF-70]|uniref:L-ornithine N(5)-monooxygenase n=2 Tax=Sclerotinia sclerotiorum (strain ATCC 18683 / 1980 / Ss-1) TaxID=665079 RepID=A7EEF6_SCLS1|nr:hypothetical protein SS1G_03696 [Sclerotinia sclerotiorum 1980 UF-70]APA12652.1 hypothetical protein sscle_09g074220 [Sclerotinia sclerotiorum 1980 UF-70]EDO01222.1 hypothetical protein SS1G_03696 [Sclerotinia sclerotiorum 1980 UF-70]